MHDKPVEPNYQVRALSRGLAVLASFTPESPRHSLSDLSKIVDVPKSTLFRLLESLCAMEFLEQEADGSFTVTFTAKPDLSVPEKDDPHFHFTVYADVTDTTPSFGPSACRTIWCGSCHSGLHQSPSCRPATEK